MDFKLLSKEAGHDTTVATKLNDIYSAGDTYSRCFGGMCSNICHLSGCSLHIVVCEHPLEGVGSYRPRDDAYSWCTCVGSIARVEDERQGRVEDERRLAVGITKGLLPYLVLPRF